MNQDLLHDQIYLVLFQTDMEVSVQPLVLTTAPATSRPEGWPQDAGRLTQQSCLRAQRRSAPP